MSTDRDDVLISSGTDRGSVVRRLACTERPVAIVERGDDSPDEQENWGAAEVLDKGCAQTRETWLHLDGGALRLGPHCVVGGESEAYGAVLRRLAGEMADIDCRAHGIDNLYVADASFFPSIGSVNPTLTIAVGALRVADAIERRRVA